jgi:hypothetical protein
MLWRLSARLGGESALCASLGLQPTRPPDTFRGMIQPDNGSSPEGAKSKGASRVPSEKLERFNEVAAMIERFAAVHLDPELTGFVLELWKRVCRTSRLDCRRGGPNVWGASSIHVIARMNFLFDKRQLVHLTFDMICDFFGVKKATVGGKASEIEKTLRLHQHSEPGLCRVDLVDAFTTIRLSNGMVMSLEMAKAMGLVPPDALPK